MREGCWRSVAFKARSRLAGKLAHRAAVAQSWFLVFCWLVEVDGPDVGVGAEVGNRVLY
jgi:hypothetical protein